MSELNARISDLETYIEAIDKRAADLHVENETLRARLSSIRAMWSRYYVVRHQFNADYHAGRYWFANPSYDRAWGQDFSNAFVALMSEALGDDDA